MQIQDIKNQINKIVEQQCIMIDSLNLFQCEHFQNATSINFRTTFKSRGSLKNLKYKKKLKG